MRITTRGATFAFVAFSLTGLSGCKILTLSPPQDAAFLHLHSLSECASLAPRNLDSGTAAEVHEQAPAHF